MSIIHCGYLAKADSLSENALYQKEIQHDFLIKTDSKTDGLLTVRAAMTSATPHPVPALRSTYVHPVTGESNAGIYLKTRDLKRLTSRDDDLNFWLCSCSWGPPEAGSSTAFPKNENPLLWPTEYSLEWASHTRFIEADINGNRMENTAYELFEPYEIDDARPVLVATKNLFPLDVVIARAIAFKDAINSDTFFGAAPHMAKIESIVSGQLQSLNEVDYYSVPHRIQFILEDEFGDGWDIRHINKGSMCYTEDGYRVPVRVLTGKQKGAWLKEAYLDQDGVQLPDGDPAIYTPNPDLTPTPEDPWQIYPALPFAALGIGGGA